METVIVVLRNQGRGRADAVYVIEYIEKETGVIVTGFNGPWDKFVEGGHSTDMLKERPQNDGAVAALAAQETVRKLVGQKVRKGYLIQRRHSVLPSWTILPNGQSSEWAFDPDEVLSAPVPPTSTPPPLVVAEDPLEPTFVFTQELEFIPPMKPTWYEEFDGDTLNPGNDIVTLKRNGWWCEVHVCKNGDVRAYTSGAARMPEVEAEMAKRITPAIPRGTILIGELVVRDHDMCQCGNDVGEHFGATSHYRKAHPAGLTLAVFDLIAYEGVSYKDIPYYLRARVAARLVDELASPMFEMVESPPGEAPGLRVTQEWMQYHIRNGAEGFCFYDPLGGYTPGRSDAVKKWKPARTYDVVITGTAKKTVHMPEGYVRLGWGWYEDLAEGKVRGVILGDDASGPRAEMEALIGRVAEVTANDLLPTKGLLYPRLGVWRPDKDPRECTYEEARRS